MSSKAEEVARKLTVPSISDADRDRVPWSCGECGTRSRHFANTADDDVCDDCAELLRTLLTKEQ